MDAASQKRAVNVSLSAEILAAAREARVNLSALLEWALIDELARRKREQWRETNAKAVALYNEHVLSHGACFDGRFDE